MSLPRLLIRLRFGRARRPSATYEALVERYQEKLAEGATAGPFSPSAHEEPDRVAWRKTIMKQHREAQEQLLDEIARWPEEPLDRLMLPHPVLGKLTIREMLYFTLYHQQHHLNNVRKPRPAPGQQ